MTSFLHTIRDAFRRRAKSAERRPRRILFCTFNYAPGATSGGAEKQAQLQAEELTRRGYRVTVVCPREPGCSSGMVNGVNVHRLPIRWAGRGRKPQHALLLAAYLLLNLRRHDLVHVHLAGLQTDVVGLVSRLVRRPMYVKVASGGAAGDVHGYSGLPYWPRRYGLRRADRVQAISEEIAADLHAVGIPESRIVRIPNGLDQERFRRADAGARAELRRRLDMPTEATIVLYVGRFDRQKGVFDLLDVWAKRDVSRESLLVLVGGNDWSAVDPEGLQRDGVQVRDWSPRIHEYYQAADIFVLPSYSEGMSNALLEAMSCGLPAITTNIGAAPEMIEDGESGLLMAPGDRETLGRHLDMLLSSPEDRQRLGVAAAQAVQRYSIGAVVDRIEREYTQLLAPASTAVEAGAPELRR